MNPIDSSAQNPTENPSPSLEVISKTIRPSGNGENYMLARLALGSEQFRISKGDGHLFSVKDLSLSGMGLWLSDPSEQSLFTLGEEIEGYVNLHNQKIFLKAQIRSIRVDRVGCQFTELSLESKDGIERFCSPDTQMYFLRPMPSPELRTLWYTGPLTTDIILNQNHDGEFYKLSLFFQNTYVRWSMKEGSEESDSLRTGRLFYPKEHCEVRGVHRYIPLILEPDATNDVEKLRVAKNLLLSSNLSQELKTWCLSRLTSE